MRGLSLRPYGGWVIAFLILTKKTTCPGAGREPQQRYCAGYLAAFGLTTITAPY